MFPDGAREGLYHTADASLWFFHAINRFVRATGDTETLRALVPTLLDIVHHHLQGTRFGIGVDPADGLLRQGAEGYQLTWMDAKVDDWVVTPRRGKAVEINALWFNALCLLSTWTTQLASTMDSVCTRTPNAPAARSTSVSGIADGGYLYDVVDGERGDDAACRPNQVFAISLDHPVLDESRWKPVMDVVRERLVTPVGLRSLAPGHPDYKSKYFGDLRSRDAAYHQGTVWAWLIGPLRRCVAEAASRRSRRCARLAARLPGTPQRSLRRIDQRDLRRRAAVHSTRLHRAGVERRGGAESVEGNGEQQGA